MIIDIENKEVNVGDTCILSVNNKGVAKVLITRFTETTIYYDIITGPHDRKLSNKNFILILTSKYNLYKL